MGTNQKFSPIPQICILEATILAGNNSCQFSQLSRKIYIVYKNLSQDEFAPGYVGLEVSHPDYVSISEKLSPIPQISIPEATILG